LCENNGGNVHFDFMRGASDLTSFDLSSYAGALTSIEGVPQLQGLYRGFRPARRQQRLDLDAVSISPIPELETCAMLMARLGLIGFMARQKKASCGLGTQGDVV
jgi:hypothetical protein